MSKEIIAIDVDEVLFPFLENFLTDHNPRYGTSHEVTDFFSYDWEHTLGIPQDETVRRVYDYTMSDHGHIEAIEGSQEAIATLAEQYDLMIITARHPQFEATTMHWVHNRFERVFNKIVCVGYAPIMENPISKAEACFELGAVALIDDSITHTRLCADAGIDGVLFGDYPWNQADKLPEGVTRCETWTQVVEYFDKRD